jgi:hypothetical protein
MRLLCAATLALMSLTPVAAGDPGLTPDEVAIYRAFLKTYNNGSKASLNLGRTTLPFDQPLHSGDSCLKGLDLDLSAAKTSRPFPSDFGNGLNLRLVDPKAQQQAVRQHDPSNAIRNGSAAGPAVSAGFAAGLLEFSTIAFDKAHRNAVFRFSFYCGGLCGHGGTLIFKKSGGIWKASSKTCGNWVS